MFKNYQLIHILGKSKPSTTIYAATTTTNINNTTITTNTTNGTLTLSSNSSTKKDLVTIKVIDIEELKDYKLVINEINTTKSIRHPNILPLLNSLVKDSQIWLVYPYMYYGSCRDILNSINDLNDLSDGQIDLVDEQKRLCFNEQSLQIISKSILNALDYLHSKHLIHRCVCPDNIYINQNGHVYLSGLNYCVSLLDQGTLYKKLHDYSTHFHDYLNYLSPEILKQNLIGYNTKSDIYSFGVTLCELANGVNPFVGCETAQMLFEKLAGFDIGLWDRNILTSESKNLIDSTTVCINENPKVIASVQRRFYSERFRNFVDLCVVRNVEFRPNASDLLEHSFIKKFKQSHNIQSIFQISVMADGLMERQKKTISLKLSQNNNNSASSSSPSNELNETTTFNANNISSSNFISNLNWNF